MINDGWVSLWVGRAESFEALERTLTGSYTEDGDSVAGEFARFFQIKRFDEDFREAKVLDADVNLIGEALEGCSEDRKVISEFRRVVGDALPESCNAVVLLYNYRFNGSDEEFRVPGVSLRYVGCVNYR